jgi:putative ABC transport system permease protein
MIFLKLIFTNLLRHRVRTLVSIAGIAFSVAAMLTVVTIQQGAVAMFSGVLSNDSELIVLERNVSDLFFSNVPDDTVAQIGGWPTVQHADPVLFRNRIQRGSSHHHLFRGKRSRCPDPARNVARG